MTPNERSILKYMVAQSGSLASWSMLRQQFCLSEGALVVHINSLKRHLQVEQDGMSYRITAVGRAALERFVNPPKREPFANMQAW